MAGYWPQSFSFSVFIDLEFVSVHKHGKKKKLAWPAILTSSSVNNPYIYLKTGQINSIVTTDQPLHYEFLTRQSCSQVIVLTEAISKVKVAWFFLLMHQSSSNFHITPSNPLPRWIWHFQFSVWQICHPRLKIVLKCPTLGAYLRTNTPTRVVIFLLPWAQGWRSGKSARLPPMCPGFDSRTRCHMWVEFVVGSLLWSERFFSGYSGFPLSSKTNISKWAFGSGDCASTS